MIINKLTYLDFYQVKLDIYIELADLRCKISHRTDLPLYKKALTSPNITVVYYAYRTRKYMKRDKPFTINTITVAIIVTIGMTTIAIMVIASTSVRAQQINPAEQQSVEFRVQNTSMSVPAPNAKLNNQSMPHQIVLAVPLRQDGKIWTGTATFTASKPIEVEIVHRYNPSISPDAKHGEPYHAKWIDGKTPIALSTMTMFTNTPVIVTNTPISTGSFVFTGSALLFHKTDGQPFTVTYTVDAIAESLIK